jgi:hypothetical protein
MVWKRIASDSRIAAPASTGARGTAATSICREPCEKTLNSRMAARRMMAARTSRRRLRMILIKRRMGASLLLPQRHCEERKRRSNPALPR